MTGTDRTVVTAIVGREFRYAETPEDVDNVIRGVIGQSRPAQVYVWDRRCRQSDDGTVHEFPHRRLRVTVDPDAGVGALNYMDPGAADGALVDSYNPDADAGNRLVFDPEGDLWFPASATVSSTLVEQAIREHIATWGRPTCVQWQPGVWS